MQFGQVCQNVSFPVARGDPVGCSLSMAELEERKQMEMITNLSNQGEYTVARNTLLYFLKQIQVFFFRNNLSCVSLKSLDFHMWQLCP